MAEALTHNLKLIGRYSILRELRRDRHTVAYLAFDPVLDREVFIKAVQLRAAGGGPAAADDRLDQAYTRQAQAAGRLHHPHIVSVFDAGRVQNIGYLALEKVDGPFLADALAKGFRPGPFQAADLVARVAEAVEFAHARGIPHGHLGVSRIVLQEPDRVPKVMGFGGWIDTGLTGDFELSATEAMLPYFQNELGPEARRRDVRALGALLFLLLTGKRPEPSATRSSESPIIELCPTAPFVLAEIAEAALELRGLKPFGTAGRMRQALLDFLHGQRGMAPHPTASLGSPDATVARTLTTPPTTTAVARKGAAASPARRRLRLGAAAAALVALATVLTVGLAGDPDPTSPSPGRTGTRPAVTAPLAGVAPATAPAPRTAAQTTTFGPATAAATKAAPQPSPRFQ